VHTWALLSFIAILNNHEKTDWQLVRDGLLLTLPTLVGEGELATGNPEVNICKDSLRDRGLSLLESILLESSFDVSSLGVSPCEDKELNVQGITLIKNVA